MSSNKQRTPLLSPKLPKTVALAPQTPPSGKKRLLAFLQTPEQPQDQLPFSPGLKRTNLGVLKSPDYKLNNEMLSPYSSNNVLKTPRNSGYDSDDKETPRKSKLMRTPQFFSPGRRLFADDASPNKKELGEISSQLKSRLSLALGALQLKERAGVAPVKLDFSDTLHTSTRQSPPRKARPVSASLVPSPSMHRANVNLQTLQQSPLQPRSAPARQGELRLRQSPVLLSERGSVGVPSPDEESSAHNALLAAFSRVRERRRSNADEQRRSSIVPALHEPAHMKLPPINIPLAAKPNAESEQEAVYSLMSLASPQLRKKTNGGPPNALPALSRLSSVAVPTLPPILGLIRKLDDDETDVEEMTASDDDSA